MSFYLSLAGDEYLISQSSFQNSELLHQTDLSRLNECGSVRKLRICGKSYLSRSEAPEFDISGVFLFRSIRDNLISLKLENIRVGLSETINEQQIPNLEYLLLNTCQLTEGQLRKLLVNQKKLKQVIQWCSVDRLDLKRIEFSQISPRLQLSNIMEVNIDNSTLGSLKYFKDLVYLESISFKNTQIASIKELDSLSMLAQIIGDNSKISELPDSINLNALRTLSLNSCPLVSLKGAEHLHALEFLFVNKTQITSLKEIQYLPLRELECMECKIEDDNCWDHLENMRQLMSVKLYKSLVNSDKQKLQKLLDNNPMNVYLDSPTYFFPTIFSDKQQANWDKKDIELRERNMMATELHQLRHSICQQQIELQSLQYKNALKDAEQTRLERVENQLEQQIQSQLIKMQALQQTIQQLLTKQQM